MNPPPARLRPLASVASKPPARVFVQQQFKPTAVDCHDSSSSRGQLFQPDVTLLLAHVLIRCNGYVEMKRCFDGLIAV